MPWLFVALSLVATAGRAAQAPPDVARAPVCRGVTVSVSADTARVKAGERPRFSARIHNTTSRPVRLLDVRQGRRADLQDSYFELFVARGTALVDLPRVISDPGPLDRGDFFDLLPGASAEITNLSYTGALDELPPGQYDAFLLFWRDPLSSHTTRCRSTAARFVVETKEPQRALAIHRAEYEARSGLEPVKASYGQVLWMRHEPDLDERDVRRVEFVEDSDGLPAIKLTFTPEGSVRFRRLTREHLRRKLIFLFKADSSWIRSSLPRRRAISR